MTQINNPDSAILIRDVIFNGGSGKLEGKYYLSSKQASPAVLILHPHPLYGGNMDNKIVYAMFHEFVAADCTVLRFNFRGVGNSEGVFDGAGGEVLDASLAMDALHDISPYSEEFWICAYSFSGPIALQIVLRRNEVKHFILVAPAIQTCDLNLFPCQASGCIVHGTKDNIVSENSSYSLYQRMNRLRGSNVEYISVDGADHFFTDHIDAIKSSVSSYIKRNLQHES